MRFGCKSNMSEAEHRDYTWKTLPHRKLMERPNTTSTVTSKRGAVRKFFRDLVSRLRGVDDSSALTSRNTVSNLPKLSSSDQLLTLRAASKYTSDHFRQFSRLPSSTGLEKPLQKRVVVISGLPQKVSVPAVVAGICGGALEKIVYYDKMKPELEVYFLSPGSAAKFYEYATTSGLFNVNGNRVKVSWAENTDGSKGHAPIPVYLAEEVEAFHASRVITFSKATKTKTSKVTLSKRIHPKATDHFVKDFNVESIKWDLVQFGGIVEVTPVVSRKLSVSIQFTDIRSAILVMHAMEQKTSMLHSKYSLWTARYGKDPADRPCLCL